MAKPTSEELKLVSLRLDVSLIHRIEEARVDCRPLPSKQAFFHHLLLEGLKRTEALK